MKRKIILTILLIALGISGVLTASAQEGATPENGVSVTVYNQGTALIQDRRKRGGLLVHLGIVTLVIGLCGNFFGHETAFTLYPGQSHDFSGYQLTFTESQEFPVANTRTLAAVIEVTQGDREVARLKPAKAFYPTRPEPMTEVAIHRTLFHDLYLSLSSINDDGSATLNVFYNPMVNFVWASMGLFALGLGFSLSYKPVQKRGGSLLD